MIKSNIDKLVNGSYIILIGFLLLMISMSFLKVSIIFQLLRLWPLFIVIVGIEIILKRTGIYFLKVLSPIIIISSLLVMIYIYQDGNMFVPRKIEISKINQRMISSDKITDFNIDFSHGELRITDGKESLIRGDLSLPPGARPEMNFQEFEAENLFKMSSNLMSKYSFGPWDKEHLWILAINKDAPNKIKIKSYASRNNLNISKLATNNFLLETTFSYNEIILNENVEKVRIDSFGSLIKVLVPKEVGLKINVDENLIIENFKELKLERSFRNYTSPGYDGMEKRIELDLYLKLSKIDIKFINN